MDAERKVEIIELTEQIILEATEYRAKDRMNILRWLEDELGIANFIKEREQNAK